MPHHHRHGQHALRGRRSQGVPRMVDHTDIPLPLPMAQRGRDYQRQRQYSTGDILLDNRIIFFGFGLGTYYEPIINDVTANIVIQQMLYLQYENKTQDIHFYINSPGGSVTAMLAIYDTMNFLE